MKFGGSCFQSIELFNKVIDITEIYGDHKKIYVASAFKGITDQLLEMGKKAADGINVDKDIALIEIKHNDIINDIFRDNVEYANVAKDFIAEKVSELKNVLVDVEEFGFEPYYHDYVLSFGELFSTYVLSLYLKTIGYSVIFVPASKLIITDDNFGNAYPLYEYTETLIKKKLIPLLNNPNDSTIFCVTGYFARNKMGSITTLGRGGSDYTATILARVIYDTCKFKDIKVILWKDVDGLLISDPKYVEYIAPRLIKSLNYNEAKEIAFFGTKILHPKCLDAIEPRHIPLEIRNFEKPLEESQFTLISEKSDKFKIKGISTVEDAAMITVSSGSLVGIPGILSKIFRTMGENKINVSLVAQSSSEINTTFIVKASEGEKALILLKKNPDFKNFFDIKIEHVGVIAVVGLRIIDSKIKARIFSALGKKNILVKALSQSSEGLNISIVIKKQDIENAVNTLTKEFLY